MGIWPILLFYCIGLVAVVKIVWLLVYYWSVQDGLFHEKKSSCFSENMNYNNSESCFLGSGTDFTVSPLWLFVKVDKCKSHTDFMDNLSPWSVTIPPKYRKISEHRKAVYITTIGKPKTLTRQINIGSLHVMV